MCNIVAQHGLQTVNDQIQGVLVKFAFQADLPGKCEDLYPFQMEQPANGCSIRCDYGLRIAREIKMRFVTLYN